MVVGPEGFAEWVKQHSAGEMVQWISLDPALFDEAPGWKEMAARGEKMMLSADGLAAGVAELGEERAREGKFTDPLLLDANYVRRSDAEIFWKDPASHGKGGYSETRLCDSRVQGRRGRGAGGGKSAGRGRGAAGNGEAAGGFCVRQRARRYRFGNRGGKAGVGRG